VFGTADMRGDSEPLDHFLIVDGDSRMERLGYGETPQVVVYGTYRVVDGNGVTLEETPIVMNLDADRRELPWALARRLAALAVHTSERADHPRNGSA
jgi:hypothetical protein